MSKLFTVLLGAQFGDEGKGKIIDFLSHKFDYVVRYQGGDNAGHTINIDGKKHVLKLIPSGIFQTNAIIAPGTVVNPINLLDEISQLNKIGIITENKLFISDLAHVIFDFHIAWDHLCEKIRGNEAIGCTYRGIGPCYSDKNARIGLRMIDLFDYDVLLTKITINLAVKNPIFEKYGMETFEPQEVAKKYFDIAKKLKGFLVNYFNFFHDEVKKNKTFLFEGSQGMLLDLDCGTYPFVTSSNMMSSLMSGAYLVSKNINRVVGIVKAYTSRVGNGILITEIEDKKLMKHIQTVGHEFGSVTQRPRRIGWLDLVCVKYSVTLSGMNEIALTLIDVLDGVSEIKVCIGYKDKNGKELPIQLPDKTVTPIYKTFKGWKEKYDKIKSFDDFSDELKNYVKFIEEFLNVKIKIISFGKDRNCTITKN